MSALSCSLINSLLDVDRQHLAEELSHATQHLGGELTMGCSVIDVLSDRDEAYSMFSENRQ